MFLINATVVFGDTMVSEDVVKAAYIFHFINFVEWEDHEPEYYICIPDDENLREVTRGSLQNKVVNNRKIVVLNRLDQCHILISDRQVQLSDTTLTIGLLDKGALLEFRLVHNKMKFAVNPKQIRDSKLKISSQLLKLAIIESGS